MCFWLYIQHNQSNMAGKSTVQIDFPCCPIKKKDVPSGQFTDVGLIIRRNVQFTEAYCASHFETLPSIF